jgi:hypothetical protein
VSALFIQLFTQTDAGARRETVLPVKRNRLEARGSIERESRCLPDAGFEDEPPGASCPGLGLERGHETAAQTCPADRGIHIHPLELGRLVVDEPKRAATDRSAVPVDDAIKSARAMVIVSDVIT